MRKLLFIVFILLVIDLNIYCQENEKLNKLEFRLVCYPNVIHSKQRLSCVFEIQNISKDTINVPSEYLGSVPTNHSASVEYEVKYVNGKDTIVLTNYVLMHIGGDFIFKNDQRLLPNKKTLFVIEVSPTFFKRIGMYQIKFKLRHSFFPGILFSDIMTDWNTINVEGSELLNNLPNRGITDFRYSGKP